MSEIDFVPEDYIQKRQSNRANWLYLVLLVVVLAGIAGTFSVLKMREKGIQQELAALDAKLGKAQEQIKLLEELESKGKEMMKTALITAELPDVIGKSVILACLTNNLPGGVSLTDLEITDTESKIKVEDSKAKSQYQAAKAKAAAKKKKAPLTKTVLNTNIDVSGVAPSDIEVANYIALLETSFLIKDVGLVESIEKDVDDATYRQFKLHVKLNRDSKLTKENIDQIKLVGKKQ